MAQEKWPARRAGAEGDRRVAVRDQAVLEVARHGCRSGRRARCGGRAQAVAGGPARVGRLRPAGAAVEREVDPQTPTPAVNGHVAGSPAAQDSSSISSLEPGDDDARRVGVDRDGRLVLLVL